MITYEQFLDNLVQLRQKVNDACSDCGRDPSTVKILPVTKNHPKEVVEYVYRAGVKVVGENRIQEAIDKKSKLDIPVQWELIGHLQSNKVNLAIEYFDRIQSVDSLKLLNILNTALDKKVQIGRILLQVNAGNDPAKFGVSIEEAPALLNHALSLRNLKVEGLMTIAPLSKDIDIVRECFIRLKKLRNELEQKISYSLPELSMGMSNDLIPAIQSGSTLIRIGTALFGTR